MLVLGIDDAGRGPLIGPMMLAGVLLTNDQERLLQRNNVRDSKVVTHRERIALGKIIEDNATAFHVAKTFPEELDYALTHGTNLNTLEAQKAAEIINTLNNARRHKDTIKVIIDCPSTNTNAWCATLMKYVTHPDNLKVSCEHKADANHVSAAAGSILAKVAREEEVEKIQKKYGDIGSGYPSDPATKEFLKMRGAELKDSGIFRKTWATWKAMFPEEGQASLSGF